MTNDASLPDQEEKVLARFILELDSATDRQSVVQRYAGLHPALAEELVQFEEMNRTVASAGGESAGEALKQLGEFRVVRRIASGGMGVIYEAVQERLNRRVAVKTIRRGTISPQARGRFFREQRVLARLHQTHIVPIHAAGEENELLFFAMPFIEGITLKRLVQEVSRIDWREYDGRQPFLTQLIDRAASQTFEDENAPAVNNHEPVLLMKYFRAMASVIADAAEALEHAHRLQILHRDLKPSNIMIDRSGQCWIIDFGLAGYLGQSSETPIGDIEKESAESLTAGKILGTPQYMAPEQWRGEPATAATDVWGLGATLFEVLTLRRAEIDSSTQTPSPQEVVTRRRFMATVPGDLAAICDKAMRVDPGERYPSAQALADDLRRWRGHEPVSARPAWAWRRAGLWIRRNPGWAAALALLLATVLGLVWAMFEAERHESAKKQLGMEQDRRKQADATTRRQLLMPDLHQLRLAARMAGWRDEALRKAQTIHAIQPGKDVRDEAAAALIGLDVHQSASYPFPASSLLFDAGGHTLLLGGANDRYGKPQSPARLVDLATNTVTLTSERNGTGPVAFLASGDACHLIPQEDDARQIVLWDIKQQRELSRYCIAPKRTAQALTEFNRPVLTLSKDGARAAGFMRSQGDTIYVWETGTGKLMRQWQRSCESLAFSPDGTLLALGDSSGKVTIYSLNDAEEMMELNAGDIVITALAFGHDPVQHPESKYGKWQLASGDAGTRVTVWDLHTRQRRCHCDGALYGVSSLDFSSDGMILASAGRSLVLWDAATGKRHLSVNVSDIAGVRFDPSGRRLAACMDEAVPGASASFVWQLEMGRGAVSLGGLVGPLAKIAFSRDGKYIAALSQQWQVAVWNLAESRLLHVFDGPHGEFVDNAALAFDSEGTKLACIGGARAKMWDVAQGHTLRSWALPIGLQDALAFDSTGQQLWSVRCETSTGAPPYSHAAVKDHPRCYRLRNLLTADPPAFHEIVPTDDLGKDDHPVEIVMTPDAGTVIISGHRKNGEQRQTTIRGYSLPDRTELWHVQNPGGSLYVEPTGRLVSYHEERRGIIYVECRTGNFVMSEAGRLSASGVWWLRGSHLGRRESELANVDIDRVLTGDPRFSPCGRYLAQGCRDGSLIVVDLGLFQSLLLK